MAATPDGDGLFPGRPHCGGPVVALLHAGRAAVLMCISPWYPGAGREVLVSLPASSIVTGDVSRACLSGTHHLHWPRPGPPRTGHHPLRLSPWEQVGHWSGSLSLPSSCAGRTGASCRGLHFLLGDLSGLTRGSLRPPRQRYPRQVRTLMEVALSSHQSMIIPALLDPSGEVP